MMKMPAGSRLLLGEEITSVQVSSEWDAPIYAIYLSHLAPLFAACDCPFYGVEETQSWNDPDLPICAGGRSLLCWEY